MHTVFSGRIGRAKGTNEHLRRKQPLYALTDPSPPGTPSIRAVAGGPMRLTSRVSWSAYLILAHVFAGEMTYTNRSRWFTDFVVRTAYENPEYATERFFARECELPRISVLGNSRRSSPLCAVAGSVRLTTV